jgi:hypothetical protein
LFFYKNYKKYYKIVITQSYYIKNIPQNWLHNMNMIPLYFALVKILRLVGLLYLEQIFLFNTYDMRCCHIIFVF